YNRWPAWRSLYDFQDSRWHTDVGNEVGFDRPYSLYYNALPSSFNPLSNGSGEFLLWEHPLCYWLEKEGYDVSYVSNLDTHRDPASLLRAKGFLSVGHDEYWTSEMFDNVCAARDAGVNVAFLSGNAVSGRVYLKPSSTGQPDRIFGRWEQGPTCEFENAPELMGSSSYGVGAADWICQMPDHWIFEGTGMKEGDAIPQLVGWEYHGEPLKDDPTLQVLARGAVRVYEHSSDKTYAATIYESPSGSFVFNAATCWWSMLLARPPGAVNPPNTDFTRVDPRVERITRNLLDRMTRLSLR
ncbi:MAG TPA: N,N-dimethylformamidase beta subunit family domain-containing protein, partial [Fimbriimonas sp.]|nr:N,N-dimethylformamidase beta subunit family domain-containing protein [Fimbriimonas sp.]